MSPDIPFETLTAVRRLKAEHIWYQMKTPFHLKVDRYNFWPKRGSIHIDGQHSAFPQKGLDAFIKLIKDDTSTFARFRHERQSSRTAGCDNTNAEPEPGVIKLNILS